MLAISYVSETPEEWNRALDNAKTLKQLQEACKRFEVVAGDALDVAITMTTNDFKRWRRGLAKERKQVFAGHKWAERFGAILMPEVMMKVSIVAVRFVVPWGCAFIRLRDEGMLVIKGERAFPRGI